MAACAYNWGGWCHALGEKGCGSYSGVRECQHWERLCPAVHVESSCFEVLWLPEADLVCSSLGLDFATLAQTWRFIQDQGNFVMHDFVVHIDHVMVEPSTEVRKLRSLTWRAPYFNM